MNCPQCIASISGFLRAYWLTLSVSLCVFLSALLIFIWFIRSGEWKNLEKNKFEMLEEEEKKENKNGIS